MRDRESTTLVVLVWLLGAAILMAGVLALSGPKSIFALPPALPQVWAAIYGVALVATLHRWTRSFGLGVLGAAGVLVGGFGTVAMLLLSPFLLSGAGADRDAQVAIAAMVAVPVLHLPLAVTAYWGMWRASRNAADLFALPFGAIVVLLTIATSRVAIEDWGQYLRGQRQATAAALPEVRAEKVIDLIERCLTGSSRRSWPRSMDDLGPAGLGCLSEQQLRPVDGAYAVHVVASPVATTPPQVSAACVTYPYKGQVAARVTDERGNWHFYSGGGLADSAAEACATTDGDALRKLRYCLWSYAAAHDGGYPERMELLDGYCLRNDDYGVRRVYTPGEVGADALIRRFVLTEEAITPRPGAVSRRLDETGVVRATTEPRAATTDDSTDIEVRRRLAAEAGFPQSPR